MEQLKVFVTFFLKVFKILQGHFNYDSPPCVIQIHAYCERPDIVLVGNKADLQRIRMISESRARGFAEQYNLPYIETSVLSGENVKKAFDMLLDMVMSR